MKKILLILFFPVISFSQIEFLSNLTNKSTIEKMDFQQTQDINYVKNIKNNTNLNSYTTKDKIEIKLGDTITIGSAINDSKKYQMDDVFSFIAIGNIKGSTKDPQYLSHKNNNQKVIVQSIYVKHERYSGYNPLYNRKETPLFVSVYAKKLKINGINLDNISQAMSNKRITIIDIEKALKSGEVYNKNTVLSKSDAIKKLKEAKDLFELDLMSESEYNKLRDRLTPIILEAK